MKIDGKPVVDGQRRIKITITPQDVSLGKSKNPTSCAAAQACIRQLHIPAARVHVGRTYLLMGNKWVRYHTPESLRTEIISFDRGTKFSPGDYTLTPMQPTHRGNGKRQGSAKPPTFKKKRAKPHFATGVRVSAKVY